jgi:hypothetical protein
MRTIAIAVVAVAMTAMAAPPSPASTGAATTSQPEKKESLWRKLRHPNATSRRPVDKKGHPVTGASSRKKG